MATIQEAMEEAGELLARAVEARIDSETFSHELTALLQSPISTRGFMAALAISDLPAAAEIRRPLLEAIKKNKETTYDLILKNIVMPVCAAQEHDRQNRPDLASLSRRTCDNSLDLALLLADPTLVEMARDLLAAIDHLPEKTAVTGRNIEHVNEWYEFFERWHYAKEALLAAEKPLAKIANSQ